VSPIAGLGPIAQALRGGADVSLVSTRGDKGVERGWPVDARSRPRSHQLVDLLLGLFLLISVVAVAAKLSAILAAAIFVAVTVAYLVRLRAREPRRDEAVSNAPAGTVHLEPSPLDQLETHLAEASRVHFTDQVLIERDRLLDLIDEVRAAAPGPRADVRIEELANLIRSAPSVPSTGRFRISRTRAARLVAEIGAAQGVRSLEP
jgi:hypothetical protein